MRLHPFALVLLLAACKAGTTAAPVPALTPEVLAHAPAATVAACGMNELAMMGAASELQTRVTLGGAGSSTAYRQMFVRLVNEGGAGDTFWFDEVRARKGDAEMEAAWKAAGERPSPVQEALKLDEPAAVHEALLAASPALIDASLACRRAAQGGA